MAARVKPADERPVEPGSVRVVSPMGTETDVHECIVEALVASGYVKK